jgi:hypothetical protein
MQNAVQTATAPHGYFGSQKLKQHNAPRAYNSIPLNPRLTAPAARKQAGQTKLKSANHLLRDVHQILMYERERNRANLGNTLFGTNEVFAPVRDLKRDLIGQYGHM